MKIQLSKISLPDNDLRAMINEDSLAELADSMRDHGQLQPIGVYATGDDSYEVIFGSRRTRAARSLGWLEIEATLGISTNGEVNAAQKLIENVQRESLTPIEEAYGLMALIGDGEMNVRNLQRQTGKSRDWIKNRLELLSLPDDIQGAVQSGLLGVAVAKALGSINHPDVRAQYIESAISNGCTAEQAVIWAGQSQFAEQGFLSMQDSTDANEQMFHEPQIIDQQYHCFKCGIVYSWRKVNTLVFCGECQNSITATRPVEPK